MAAPVPVEAAVPALPGLAGRKLCSGYFDGADWLNFSVPGGVDGPGPPRVPTPPSWPGAVRPSWPGQPAEAWLTARSDLRPTTRAKYDYLLCGQVFPRLGRRELARLTASDVRAWVPRSG